MRLYFLWQLHALSKRIGFSQLRISMIMTLCVLMTQTSCGGGGDKDNSGSTINIGVIAQIAPTGAPSVPKDVKAVSLPDGTVNVSWVAALNAVKYQVFLSGNPIAIAEVIGTTFNHDSASAGTQYAYEIKAVGSNGAVSEASVSAVLITPVSIDTIAPTAPSNLMAQLIGVGHVKISWSASTDNVAIAKYVVYRSDKSEPINETTTTTFDDFTVQGANNYRYFVVAVDTSKNVSTTASSQSVVTPIVLDTEAPSIPSQVMADVIASNQIDLKWTPSTDNVGVVKYQIVREGVEGVFAETNLARYSDFSVMGGKVYVYQIRALDVANNGSSLSSRVSVTTPVLPDTTAPSSPISVIAQATSSTQVNVSWAASTDNVGVAKYQVFRVGTVAAIAETVGTSYSDTTVVGNTTYSYQIKALDAANNASSLSSTATIKTPVAPDTTAPTVPTSVNATTPNSTQVNLTWAASTDAVGVTKYQVFRVGTVAAIAETVGTSYSDTTVVGNTTYSYQIKALDAANNASSLSSTATIKTPMAPDTTAPTVPTSVNATASNSTQVNLTWAASTDNVGVTKYQVFRVGTVTAIAETVGTSYSDTTVVGNTTYSYQIKALDAANNASSLSSTATIKTPMAPDTTAPTVPTSVNATAPNSTQVNLTWAASADNVGVTKYQVFRVGTVAAIAETVGTSYSDTTVVGNTTYSYQIKALDAANNASSLSSTATIKTPMAPDTTAPTVPTSVNATASNSTQVNLTWAASTDNVGVTKYQVFRVGTVAAIAETVGTSYSDTTVVGNTTYSYQIKALDAANNASSLSSTATIKTPMAPDTTAPTVPTSVNATAPNSTQVNLTWAASTDAVGVTKYQVFRVGTVAAIAETVGTSYSDTTVVGNTTYSYQIKALDAANNASSLSSTATIKTPMAPDTTAPTVPTSVNATAPNSTQVNLTWAASTDNVGVTKYQVFRVGTVAAIAETVGTSYSDTTVVGNTTYSYQIKALDAANNASSLSSTATIKTPMAPDTTAPTVPTSVNATAPNSTQVNLTWAASADNVGVTKYQIFRVGTVAAIAETVGTSFSDTTVVGNTTYSYQIKALDAANNASNLSSTATVTTPSSLTVPVITTQTIDQTVTNGSSVTFSIVASGNPAPTYQWQSSPNGTTWTNISGQTTSSYTLASALVANSGTKYRAVATNSQGIVNSTAATLTVTPVYFVSTTGSNTNPGTLAQPWRTITYAVSNSSAALSGATIYVKAGLYTGEAVVFGKDNLKLIGYKTTPGDQPAILVNAANPFAAYDPNEHPIIDGGNRASGIGMSLQNRKNITVKNINITNFIDGLVAGNISQSFQENHIIDNVNVSTMGNIADDYSGHGMNFGSMSTRFSNGNKVSNSLIVNVAAEGFAFNGDNNLADNVKVYSNETSNNAPTDYYVIVTGSNNTIKNSYAQRLPGQSHIGHGFSIKSNAHHVVDFPNTVPNPPVINPQNNTFTNNTAVNMGEGFVVRHRGVRFNTFRDNFATGTFSKLTPDTAGEGNGIVIRDGASDNQFINTTITNTFTAINFVDTVEDGDTMPNPPGHPGNNNVIDGAQVNAVYYGILFSSYSVQSDAGANIIKNSTFTLTRNIFKVDRRATQMQYINNAFGGMSANVPLPVSANTPGFNKLGTYKSDIIPSQFVGNTYTNIQGGMPLGF